MQRDNDSVLLNQSGSYGTTGGAMLNAPSDTPETDFLNTDEDTLSGTPLRSDLEQGMSSDVSAGTVAGPGFLGNLDSDTDAGLSTSTTNAFDSYAIPASINADNEAVNETETTDETSKNPLSAVASAAKSQVGELAGQAKDQVSALTAQATDRVKEQIGGQKTKAAEGLTAITEAIRTTASTLEDKGQAPIANAVTGFAGQIENFATYLQDKSVDELASDISTYARQNPQVFVGGAFLLGVAVARFLKSSGRTAVSATSTLQ